MSMEVILDHIHPDSDVVLLEASETNHSLHLLPLFVRERLLMRLGNDERSSAELLSNHPILCLKMPFRLTLHLAQHTVLLYVLPALLIIGTIGFRHI